MYAAEFEDVAFFDAEFKSTRPSWTITVIPLLLTLAERYRLISKHLIEAIVTGLRSASAFLPDPFGTQRRVYGAGSTGPAAARQRHMICLMIFK